MGRDVFGTFRDYLESLPDDLLESVTEDYVWLGGQDFEKGERNSDFRGRRECCREECARRGIPQLYQLAESTVAPRAA
ncbi:MAG: hypothetical protein ABSH44_06855 [Bryobacteraceae bacterium]|jgi:hypothetical protein